MRQFRNVEANQKNLDRVKFKHFQMATEMD